MGYTVVNGGYGGTMEASARGAVEAGGGAIGVTCAHWKSCPNPYVARVVETSRLPERLERLIDFGQAGFVVLPGGTGTLQELATVWERMGKKAMPVRPIVCVGEFWRPLVNMMASQRPRAAELVALAGSAGELGQWFPVR
ncbi:MAG: LOG family protein [Planctomycetota bacterium]|nr:LOG family protein [Planctomycetota bacterium]